MSIELKQVCYAYETGSGDEIIALQDVSLRIEAGEFVGIMGHTGSGKTTLIQLMAGLLTPTSGSVLLDDCDINSKGYDRRELRQKVGIVFQYPEYQLFETTVEKDVAFGLKHNKFAFEEVTERVKWALEAMGFSFNDVKGKSPLALSGGEKRRVAIAGVLVSRPEILIFDEPIAGLDPIGRESFLKIVSQLRRGGTAIVMVSHNADAIGECTNRLIVTDKGRIAIDSDTKAIFSDQDALKSLGLSASAPAILANMLSRRGVGLPEKITSYNELMQALKSRFAKGAEV